MSEADARYRKLATEYAKLKAQVPVLRKAFLDEQQKEVSLKDELKEKGQMVRKQEQELESLLFRNDQLSKRVSVLQDELDKGGASKRRPRTNTSAEALPQNVLDEELRRRIRENEKLHTELSQIKQETDSEVMLLKDRIDSLEFLDKQHSDTLEQLTSKHKVQLDKLREEKALLEVRAETQEKSVLEAKLAASLAADKLLHVEKAITAELEQAKRVIAEKIPFNDIRSTAFNSYNVPSHNRRYQIKVSEQLRQINSHVHDLCEHLSSVFTYLEQRYHIYPDHTLSSKGLEVNRQLCIYLKNSPSVLKSLSEAFRIFTENQPVDVVLTLDTATDLERVKDAFQSFNLHVKKLIPYISLSLAEENLLSISSQTMSAQNSKTLAAFSNFSNSLDKTSTYLSLLASQSSAVHEHPKKNQTKMLDLLSQSLSHLHQASKALGIAYNMKSQLETQLPTAQDNLESTDQCLMKAFVSTSATLAKLEKLSIFMTEIYTNISTSLAGMPQGVTNRSDPIVTQLQLQSSLYLKAIQRPVAPSIPYEVALENMKTLFSSTESRESLHEQVTKLNKKVSRLEEEKEKWMLEAQLFKIKYEKQQKVSPDASAQQAGEGSGHTLPLPTSSIKHGELGTLHQTPIASDTDEATRESLLKSHLSKRIEELTNQLQLADSKAVACHAECRALGRRLQIYNKAKLKSQDELTQANSTISHLQDELLTTKKSYDAQLMTMSEALASMNGNLASQQDEIEELKQQLRFAKKGKK
ncbi:protein phosphatase 1 regulatory subunit 21-like [Watersipora subatra]|uniref:protein phosphatase 1 regulatory subunit 21-like n=1 Tax=Watersipora subatra TaxID=2589382 RepID=UPI00355BE6F8